MKSIEYFMPLVRRPLTWLVLASLVLAIRIYQFNKPDILIDDAFISFRYAVNLANGQGLVFNPGERVEGYTNFLWIILLAICKYLGLEPIRSSKALSALAAFGILVVMYLIGNQIFANRKMAVIKTAIPLLVFATMPSQSRYVFSGMETLIFTLLLIAGIYLAFFTSYYLQTGIVFALCTMTRPEGLMYFTLVLGLQFADVFLPSQLSKPNSGLKARSIKSILVLVAGFVAFYAPYFLWRFSYYGYPFPNTYYVKVSGNLGARIVRGWEILHLLVNWWAFIPVLILSLFAFPTLLVNRIWQGFLGISISTFIYFLFIGGDFIVWFGPRMLMPVLPIMLFFTIEGLSRIVTWLPFPKRYRILIMAGSITLLLLYLYRFSWPGLPSRQINFSGQMRGWKELGIWIQAHTPPNTRIALDAAGLIPYYSQRYTIDMFGLTDLHIAHLENPNLGKGTVGHEKYDPNYILSLKPDCIVSTWLDEQGHAVSAGLGSMVNEVESLYRLRAIAKIKNGPPNNGRWVIKTSIYKPRFFHEGYVSGLFCLK